VSALVTEASPTLQREQHLQYDRIEKQLAKGDLRKAFFVGGISTCRVHIRQHYSLYKQRCKDRGIPENHHAIPRPIWKQMEQRKNNPGVKTQGTLDGVIKPVRKNKEFTREEVLHAVTQFVACNDQVGIVNMFMSRVLWYLLC
jgi:hypothetical protein